MTRDDLLFDHIETGSKGEYTAKVPGIDEVAKVTYSRLNASTVIVDHTEVPDALRGQGVAQALIAHVVSQSRRDAFKIVPLCPFFKSQLGRHPEWQDVIST